MQQQILAQKLELARLCIPLTNSRQGWQHYNVQCCCSEQSLDERINFAKDSLRSQMHLVTKTPPSIPITPITPITPIETIPQPVQTTPSPSPPMRPLGRPPLSPRQPAILSPRKAQIRSNHTA